MKKGFISNKVYTARDFVEHLTGDYFSLCDTCDEVQSILISRDICSLLAIPLTEVEKYIGKEHLVLVQFCNKNDYTQYEYCAVVVPENYATKFID